jgi:hypothetical protein
MHVAVLIGISDYKIAPQLPACTQDVSEMERLLLSTKKYGDICSISSNTNSGPLKETLRNFFARHQGSGPIQEALVYFSGHGMYHNDVLLCCSDFDPNRPSSTSISNAELDDLLRSLRPEVAVKILDACQSGAPYIKDVAPGFEKSLRESQLKAFICMASSRTDQSSYATTECSFFTDRLIDAALSKTEGVVLYRDIHAALADAFVATPEQTPFFVLQGSGLEPFAPVTPEMGELRSNRSAPPTLAKNEDSVVARISQEVHRMDTLYVSAKEVSKAIEQAGKDIKEMPLSHRVVSPFYDKVVSLDGKLPNTPGVQAVAKFAEERKWETKYFVKIQKEPQRIKVLKNAFAAVRLLPPFLEPDESEYQVKTIEKPVSLESSQPLPFEVARVLFEPKGHASLKAYALYIGLAHSLVEVVVLSAIAGLVESGWNERTVSASELAWRYQTYLWRDVVARPRLVWEEALTRGEETLAAYLQGLLPEKDKHKVADVTAESSAK